MTDPATKNLPVLFLLDETAPASIHPLISEACRRLQRQGPAGCLLSIPCPDQPAHPLLADTGPYTPWLLPDLPAHRAVVATSAPTALAALCNSASSVFWLIDRNPLEEFAESELERTLARSLLELDAVTVLSPDRALANTLPDRSRERAIVWPVLAPLRTPRPEGAPRTGFVVDHTARTTDAVTLAAEAFSASERRYGLLTDLLRPPYPEAAGFIRVRPFDRTGCYQEAAVILKLDSFHSNLPLLVRVLGSGAVLATSKEALGSLPGRHGDTLWCFSSPRDPLCIRRETERLLASDGLRAALRSRSLDLAQRLVSEAAGAEWTPSPRPGARAAELRPLACDVLKSPLSATWNRTLVRILRVWYDSTRQKPR